MAQEFSKLSRSTTDTAGSKILSYSSEGPSDDSPIAVLLHGYPQSTYIWRYMVPKLTAHTAVFVPGIPGYGESTPWTKKYNKKDIGLAILDAMKAVYGIKPGSPPRKVILIGHDRGARIWHDLIVRKEEVQGVEIVGLVVLDIAPTKAQFEAFASPKASVGYFHWPFLAKKNIAIKLISAYGGDNWCAELLHGAAGPNEEANKRFAAEGSFDKYTALNKKPEVIKATCEDYEAAALEEVARQTEDLKKGTKVEVPTLVMYSARNLGAVFDMKAVWGQYVAEGTDLQVVGVGNGIGHYLPEEAADEVGEKILQLMSGVGIPT